MQKPSSPMSIERLRELVDYDSVSGILTWRMRDPEDFEVPAKGRSWNTKFVGKEALKSKNGCGYKHGSIFNVVYRAHRLAWAIHYGEWPPKDVDHINGDRSDNRISNLRSVSRAENHKNKCVPSNNTSGVLGVSWVRQSRKWTARITTGGTVFWLGDFETFEEAVAKRKAAEREYGFHKNHGRIVA